MPVPDQQKLLDPKRLYIYIYGRHMWCLLELNFEVGGAGVVGPRATIHPSRVSVPGLAQAIYLNFCLGNASNGSFGFVEVAR